VIRLLRLLVCAAAAVCALSFSGAALAAYNPILIIANTNHAVGGSGPVVIGMGQDESDDATAAAKIYAPLGYTVTLGQAPGTQLGTVSGEAKIATLGGARREFENGTVKADNPANHVSNPCSPGMHEAVWILEFSLLGNAFRLPMYVDRVTTGPEAAYASARIEVCFPSPYLPPPQGAPSGASLLAAAFDVRGVFRSPNARGTYGWNAIFTPYTPGSATANTANAAQSTAFVRLPVTFAISVKRQKRGNRTFAILTACVREARVGVRGLRVNFLGGRTAARARRVASARTNARGCATARIRVRRTMLVLAAVDVPVRQAAQCQPTLVARCSVSSVSPAFDLLTRGRRVRR
jgi:hypothetical protein